MALRISKIRNWNTQGVWSSKICYKSTQLDQAKSQIHIHSTYIGFKMNTTFEQSSTPIVSEAPKVSKETSDQRVRPSD